MGWADLPLDLIEKIVYHAANKAAYKPYYSHIVDYGHVHPAWKQAIIHSRTIFNRDKSLTADQYCPKTVSTPFQYIDEGYLQAVQSLEISDVSDIIEFNHESIAERNSIEWIRLPLSLSDMTDTETRQINNFMKLLRKTKHFDIIIWRIETQNDAKWLLDFMRLVVHTNSHPKTIKFECESSSTIDWGFVSQAQRLEVGSIDKLTVVLNDKCACIFAHLADIDTLTVDLVEMFEPFFNGEKHNFPKDIKANRLRIKCEYELYEGSPILDKLRIDDSQRSFNFETVECVIHVDPDSSRSKTLSQVFKFDLTDATAWNKVKDWFISTHKQLDDEFGW